MASASKQNVPRLKHMIQFALIPVLHVVDELSYAHPSQIVDVFLLWSEIQETCSNIAAVNQKKPWSYCATEQVFTNLLDYFSGLKFVCLILALSVNIFKPFKAKNRL